MASKLMARKQKWAREYSAAQRAKLKLIADEQRRMFGANGEDAKRTRRELALIRAVLDTDITFQVVAIKDGRSPANRAQADRALQRYGRAEWELIRFYDFERKPDWRYGDPTPRDLMQARIDGWIERLSELPVP